MTILRETCPSCSMRNFLENNDQYLDISDYTCWNCKQQIRLFSDEFFVEYDPHVIDPDDDIASEIHVDGRE